jgi:hypothetical protein
VRVRVRRVRPGTELPAVRVRLLRPGADAGSHARLISPARVSARRNRRPGAVPDGVVESTLR